MAARSPSLDLPRPRPSSSPPPSLPHRKSHTSLRPPSPSNLSKRRPSRTLTIDPGRDPSHDPDVEDARKVWRTCSAEDFGEVKQALWNMLNKVDELSSQIRYLQSKQTDLQTTLTVAQSNLTLAMSNTEMLEEALSRTPASAQVLGWRRGANSHTQPQPQTQRWSVDSESSIASDRSPVMSPAEQGEKNGNGIFSGFRFGSSSRAATPTNPTHASLTSPPSYPTHSRLASAASASVPSLVDHTANQNPTEVDELKKQLRKERASLISVSQEKAALESEVESLSQSLFEEANKMVSEERKLRARAENDLQDAQDERDAMRRTLKLMEEENRRLQSQSGSHSRVSSLHPPPPPTSTNSYLAQSPTPSPDPSPDSSPSPTPEIQADEPSYAIDGIRTDEIWRDSHSPPPLSSAQFQVPRPLRLSPGMLDVPRSAPPFHYVGQAESDVMPGADPFGGSRTRVEDGLLAVPPGQDLSPRPIPSSSSRPGYI